MRPIGLHIRITDTIMEVAEYIQELGIPIFQCFLVDQADRQPLLINTATAQEFKNRLSNQKLYVHGSYWVNLAHLKKQGLTILHNEIEQAKQLGSQHIILHPGSAITASTHAQGIDDVAHVLNTIMMDEQDMIFILENTAHAHKTIGSNLTDFYYLKQKLEYPDRVKFCIDTAHAYAYGYDIGDIAQQNDFIHLIDITIGIHAVELIHLNDAAHPLSSRIDKHAALGEGTIGLEALKSFATNPRLSKIPLILELPVLSSAQESNMLDIVRSWHT